jgi:hypothetical protein
MRIVKLFVTNCYMWTPWINCGRRENAGGVHVVSPYLCGFELFVDNVDYENYS